MISRFHLQSASLIHTFSSSKILYQFSWFSFMKLCINFDSLPIGQEKPIPFTRAQKNLHFKDLNEEHTYGVLV